MREICFSFQRGLGDVTSTGRTEEVAEALGGWSVQRVQHPFLREEGMA